MAASNSQFAALVVPPKASDGGRSVRLSLSSHGSFSGGGTQEVIWVAVLTQRSVLASRRPDFLQSAG